MSSRPSFSFPDNIVLLLAILTTGLVSGYFAMHWMTLQPGMTEMGADIYGTMQAVITHDLRNPWFLFLFMGGGAFLALSLAFGAREWRHPSFWLIALALVIYVAGVVLYTKFVMAPINHDIQAWNPIDMPASWIDVRAQWSHLNHYRVIASIASFTLATLALVIRASTPRRT